MREIRYSIACHVRRATIAYLLAFAATLPASLSSAQQVSPPARHPSALTLNQLREGFAHPPAEAKLRCYWWWLNGHTDKATITNDLEQMKAKGFGGALLVDANGSNQSGNENVPPGPTFGSPAWMDLYTHALREADRLGLEITLNITSGWNLGGPDVTPDQASKLLTWSRIDINGGTRISLPLPAPPARNGFYREIAVLAYPLHHGPALATKAGQPALQVRSAAAETGFSMPDASSMLISGSAENAATDQANADTSLPEVRDLSGNVDAHGDLAWNAPAGPWEILRIGYTDSDARVSTSSGAWQGLAIDYLSRSAFETYWSATVEPLLAAARPYRSLEYLATDSWELGGTNWTETFAAEFKKRRGYDPIAWLPVVTGRIVDDADQSTRFLTDLRRTVADLVVSNHYDVFAAKAAEHRLGIQAESGGPHGAPIDALETFRHSAVPQSEFWSENPHRHRDVERFFTKEAASAANIYGKKFVAQEGETSIGPQWSESLATDLKPSFDMAVTEGLNRLVWHEFTSSPASTGLPGQEYFAGTHLNPKVTWWNAGGAFFNYLNRVQFLMQQGTPVDDLLYFYGDNVPNFVRLKADDPAHVLPGYDYDVTDEDALLSTIQSAGGSLQGPGGAQWKALALPKTRRLSLPVLRKLEAYVRSGGTIIGLAPTSQTGRTTPDQAVQFHRVVSQIWGDHCDASSLHHYGSGQVFCTTDAHAALLQMHLMPDAQVSPNAAEIQNASSAGKFDYAHRRIGNTDVYFVRNGSDQHVDLNVQFRVNNRAPLIWDAVSGSTQATPRYEKQAAGLTAVSLSLPPFGSEFVVFPAHTATTGTAVVTAEVPQRAPIVSIGPWSISFQPDRGAPSGHLPIPAFTSWTDWPQPGIRYFSGTATYSAIVKRPVVPHGGLLYLHFNDLHEIARVSINAKDAGTVWAKPLTLLVDQSLLRPGDNTIEIQVTNLWPNRIIGDLQPGTNQRFTRTNITKYTAQSPLLPSGIIGSVEWLIQDPAAAPAAQH